MQGGALLGPALLLLPARPLLVVAVAAVAGLCAGHPCVEALTVLLLAICLLAVAAPAVVPVREGPLLCFLEQPLMPLVVVAPKAGALGGALLSY